MLLIYKYVTEREKKEKWQQRGNLQLIYGYLRISLWLSESHEVTNSPISPVSAQIILTPAF